MDEFEVSNEIITALKLPPVLFHASIFSFGGIRLVLVFRKDGRGRKAGFGVAAVANEFFAGKVDLGPIAGANADDPAGAHALDDEIRFKPDLDATAAQWRLSVLLGHLDNRPA